MYMPSPYNSLVRSFLRALEKGDLGVSALQPLVAADGVLHAPVGAGEDTVDHTGPAGVSAYLTGLQEATGGTLELKPQSFELRDRGAVSLLDVSGTRDGAPFAEKVRLIMGLAGGRIQELWLDPGDRESFGRVFGA